ncbi:cation diffusion facilitator family transporter [Salinibacter ruber]|uniref:cation diffusion facilitator family transporter n=1 Tax=Salinibacter ruber TaxID=146919 RepID=UPI002167117E|nr:cation diffusion facilitator family transporter [Salinibacter ruber]MCS3626568.1 cation diffusion facilitator family transporter [Salinibacter ruber]MCS4143596.1 cation diffusion facilitator family transporter [Salinibacter ruber]
MVESQSPHDESRAEAERARRRAMTASLLVSFLMLVGKLTAASLTGSTAILSDAAESVIHLFATGFAGFSLWYASTPPDVEHPYGHGKVAYFASAVEGTLILAAAVGIGWMAVQDLVTGADLRQLDMGLYLIGGLTAVNFALGTYLVRVGRRTNSLVLESNGEHVLTDMWTSLGVIVGIGLVWITGIRWLDPAVGLLVAANIVWTATGLLRRSVYGLMDEADWEASSALLDELGTAVEEGLIASFHQVRHRTSGDQVWIEYHLMFPGDMPIHEAHARSHEVEDRVDALFPDEDVHVTAHLEPRQHDEAHPDEHREPTDPLREVLS